MVDNNELSTLLKDKKFNAKVINAMGLQENALLKKPEKESARPASTPKKKAARR